MTIKESQAYSVMMVREFCYLFDMHKEGYEPTSDIEAVLYELEYGDSEAQEITQTCSREFTVEYTVKSPYSDFKYVVGYSRVRSIVYIKVYIPSSNGWKPLDSEVSESKWEDGENSLERIAALAVLEYCASRVTDD